MGSKIYVGGLPYSTTEQQLSDLFAAHGIVPMSIQKAVLKLEYAEAYAEPEQLMLAAESPAQYSEDDEAVEQQIRRLELEMKAAAKELEFERAAAIRNKIRALRLRELELKSGG